MAWTSRDIVKLLRFGVSGVMATAVHAAVAMSLIVQTEAPPMLANALAFLSATGVSYLMNTLWSFSAPVHVRNASRFAVVSTLGLGLTALVSGGVQFAGGVPWSGIAAVACVVPPATFLAHRAWTYR
ncbi:GtrA family protein [Paraburkholderia kururiensis]|uniref:GtrA family protein n=1 Tax=Paraburkholderia kururiensis TaxID=984307 RepID=A0ABZ0WPE1_9BURK|nr:GtrA family protein [Paraburkholderia kururiensis]WQD79237.1 GtrA family protein [Paraburkholderia kururiensis]